MNAEADIDVAPCPELELRFSQMCELHTTIMSNCALRRSFASPLSSR
jgi:hypothetical protein